MHVAAYLGCDVGAQPTDPAEGIAFAWLGQFPPDMTFVLAIGRDAAAFHDHGGRAEMLFQMGPFGCDVAGVQIDDNSLHLQDMLGAGLPRRCNSAGDHIDRGALTTCPLGEGRELVRRGLIGLDPDVVRPSVVSLALVDEAAHRHEALAIAKDHVQEVSD